MARRLRLNSRMGILADGTEVHPGLSPEQFHGPGTAQHRLQRIQPARTAHPLG